MMYEQTPDYNMNWIDLIAEISLQWTPKSLTGAMANHPLYKSMFSFRDHMM